MIGMEAPPSETWFLYLLRCRDGSLYTGVAKDLVRRCRQHNQGKASRFTRGRRPVRLVYQETHPNRSQAQKREAAVKALSRREKLALIRRAGRRPPSNSEK
jgi:putative endonuclease